MKNTGSLFNREISMVAEMNWVYPVGMVVLGSFFFLFLNSRVPVRQKYRRGMRK